jgi:hypothetical protein
LPWHSWVFSNFPNLWQESERGVHHFACNCI